MAIVKAHYRSYKRPVPEYIGKRAKERERRGRLNRSGEIRYPMEVFI